MKMDGVIFDCKDLLPTQAKGAIINVVLSGQSGHDSASFVCADSEGHFRESHNTENSFTNYNTNWVGGSLFCPFINGTQQLKFRLDSDFTRADQNISCFATVIGWF
jgi:hypothetical protein